MKKLVLLTVLLGAMPITMMAQDDDLYFVPTKENVAKEAAKYGMPDNTYYAGSSRSADEYNRRVWSSVAPIDSAGNDIIDFSAERGVYPDSTYSDVSDYQYTTRMSRFDDYTPSEAYWKGYRDGRWTSPWYYGSYYSWYDPWYDPWYYGYSGYWGWHSPWYYSIWYSPWYYGYYGYYGYRPYYWGGRYGHYHYGSYNAWKHSSHSPYRYHQYTNRGRTTGGHQGRSTYGNSSRTSHSGNYGGSRSTYTPSHSSGGSFGGGRSGGFSGGGRSVGGGRSYGGRR